MAASLLIGLLVAIGAAAQESADSADSADSAESDADHAMPSRLATRSLLLDADRAEGRIVAAGTQADRGFIDSGVRILEKGWKVPSEPMMHHLRRAYALADLLERDGKIPKSRKLFAWVASKAPEFGDAAERAAN